MRREKIREVVEEVLTMRERPATVDTLTIDFVKRTIRLRGRQIAAETDIVSIPLLDTAHLIIWNGKDHL